MKLSKSQQEIIDLMSNGWQLAQSMSFDGRPWIQKGGAGRGGESRRVRIDTIRALRQKGLIEPDEVKFPKTTYRMKEPGP